MKLFDSFEAVRFPEENLIFVTKNEYLYYIYDPEYKYWRKHRNAGNDSITVSNYQDISKKEILKIMGGKFPTRETDFMRFCNPSQLWITDMLDLFEEDYPNYMSDNSIYHSIHEFLLESDICYKSFLALKELLDNASACNEDNEKVFNQIKALCFDFLGRDIFKREIGIVDGHDSSSYFWIMPVRVIDYTDTNDIDSVAEMRSIEISIEEDDVSQYLTPFLFKYFDNKLEANKKRISEYWTDDEGNKQFSTVEGFEWYLTPNFYTFDSTAAILEDIKDTADALSSGRENPYTAELKKKRGAATYELYAKDLTDEQVKEYNENRPTEDDTETNLIIDFYNRFLYRMEYMMRVGAEKGYNLISFRGP